jgi:short-subunit dehydrogenase
MNFHDKVIIITGASAGIGAQLALALLREKAKVVLAGRRKAKLEEVIAASGHAENALAVPTDVTRLADLQALVDATLKRYGHIDVIINNAGTSIGGPVDEVKPESAEYLVKLNLMAPIWLTQLILPILKTRPEAMIVNIGSIASLVAPPYQAFYCSTKHGLRGFNESLRRELWNTPVKVVMILPGTAESELMDDSILQKMKEIGVGRVSDAMPAEVLAQRIVTLMKKERATAIVAGKERILVKLNTWAPSLVDRVFRRVGPRIKLFLREVSKRAEALANLSHHP